MMNDNETNNLLTDILEEEKPVLKIIGKDGNAFNILALAKRTMKQHGYDQQEIDQVMNEAMSSDYNHLLQTMMKYFDVE